MMSVLNEEVLLAFVSLVEVGYILVDAEQANKSGASVFILLLDEFRHLGGQERVVLVDRLLAITFHLIFILILLNHCFLSLIPHSFLEGISQQQLSSTIHCSLVR